MTSPSGLPAIVPTLVSARSFEEYLAMFNLDDADLTGRVLDCPGGAASFAAEAGARGVDVLAVDPVYAADHAWLGEHGKSEALRGNRHTAVALASRTALRCRNTSSGSRRSTTSGSGPWYRPTTSPTLLGMVASTSATRA